jgi:hypothetical protein
VIDDASLRALEQQVQAALARGDADDLNVLGYGEISLVLAWPIEAPAFACKRLPPMPGGDSTDAFADTFRRYVKELEARGISVLATDLCSVGAGDGTSVLYCVQPVLPEGSMATDIVRQDAQRAPELLASIVEAAFAATDERVGFDGQLSNWAVFDDRLTYFDVTTPLLRGDDGTEELDVSVFLASLPWLLRAPVRRFVLPDIIERYHSPRTVVLDLAANLLKERLGGWIPTVLQAANGRLDQPLTEEEVRRDYRSDARTWAAIQRLRRLDRAWQRSVRRRPYSFLLPEAIAR